MNTFYLDTCALKWRYVNSTATAAINAIMDGSDNRVLTSTLTLLEWSSALASLCRENHMDHATYKLNERALMSDIARDRLIPLSQDQNSTIQKARLLIEYIGVVEKRSLKTGDSIQLVTAREAAYAQRAPIEFVTSDRKLFNIVDTFDTFRPYLTARFLTP